MGDGDEDKVTAEIIGARFYRVRRDPEGAISDADSCRVIINLSEILNIIE